MTEGPRVNFVMREFNRYIYTLSKLSRFGYEISVFKYTTGAVFRTAARAAGSYATLVASWKTEWMSKFVLCLS